MAFVSDNHLFYTEFRWMATGHLTEGPHPTPGPIYAQRITMDGPNAKIEKRYSARVPESARHFPTRALDQFWEIQERGQNIEQSKRAYWNSLKEKQNSSTTQPQLRPVGALRPVTEAERQAALSTPDDRWEQCVDSRPTYSPWVDEEEEDFDPPAHTKNVLTKLDAWIDEEVRDAAQAMKIDLALIRASKAYAAAKKQMEPQGKSDADQRPPRIQPGAIVLSPQNLLQHALSLPTSAFVSRPAASASNPTGTVASLNGVSLAPIGPSAASTKGARVAQQRPQQSDIVSINSQQPPRPSNPEPSLRELRLAGQKGLHDYSISGPFQMPSPLQALAQKLLQGVGDAPTAAPAASSGSSVNPPRYKPAGGPTSASAARGLTPAEAGAIASRRDKVYPSDLGSAVPEGGGISDLSDISHFVVNGHRVEKDHFSIQKSAAEQEEENIQEAIRQSLAMSAPQAASASAAAATPAPSAAVIPAPRAEPKPVPAAVPLSDLPALADDPVVDEETSQALALSMALDDQAKANVALAEAEKRETSAEVLAAFADADPVFVNDLLVPGADGSFGTSDPFEQPRL